MTRNFRLLAGGMVGIFALLRIMLLFSPNADFNVLGYNIHHLYSGILLTTATSIPLALGMREGRGRQIVVLGLGVGLGMVLDEWVYLIVTKGTNADYLLPVSFWGGLALVLVAAIGAWLWSRTREDGRTG